MYTCSSLVMATKSKLVFVFICCLLLTGKAEGSLSACLNACAGGTKAIQAFCRSIPDAQIRAVCLSVQFAGPVDCNGFCYLYFS